MSTFSKVNTFNKVSNFNKALLNVGDDVIIFGRDIDEHKKALHAMFSTLQYYGLTLNKKKCHFYRTRSRILICWYNFLS